MMSGNKMELRDIVRIGGAYIAFQIGSGFATGQEIMQFFTSFGYGSFGACLISMIIFTFVGIVITKAGKEHQLDTQTKAFQFYCGKKLGFFFEWFTPFLMFCVYVVMLAGAGATLNEYYGLNSWIGTILMAALAVGTALMGLSKLVDIIGMIGPVIVVFACVVGLVSGVTNLDGFMAAGETIQNLTVVKSSANWVISGLLYASYPLVTLIPFLANMGATTKSKEIAAKGGAFGGSVLILSVMVMNFGLLANIGSVYNKEIPSLFLADQISPLLAAVFSIILCAGIYTTAVPMLFMTCGKIAKEGTKKFNITVLVVTAVAICFGSLPFGQLVNIIYPYTGYMGLILLVCIVYRTFVKKAPATNGEAVKA